MFKYVSFFCTFTTCAICECQVIHLAFTEKAMLYFVLYFDKGVKYKGESNMR